MNQVPGRALFAASILASLFLAANGAVADPQCSVFAERPCAPEFCSVFDPEPCVIPIRYRRSQDLRLTVESGSDDGSTAASAGNRLNSIRDLFAAIRRCWTPPAADAAQPGMEMSVRLSFKRSGELMGEPRVTYTSPGVSEEARRTYRQAVFESLAACSPLPFGDRLGGAIAGRPLMIRFIDNRELTETKP